MSEQIPPTFGDDPRANAKAAKAYAKAQRPWYKKKRFIIPLALVVLIVIGSLASTGSDKGSQNDQASSTPTAKATNAQTEAPTDTTSAPAPAVKQGSKNGSGITWGNWEVVGKIQVTKEAYSNDYSVITRVRNTSSDPDEGFFTVTMLKGEQILGTATCSTSTVQPGAVGTANCSSMDKFKPGWTEITIEDAF